MRVGTDPNESLNQATESLCVVKQLRALTSDRTFESHQPYFVRRMVDAV
jgi:hypothetical protein